MKEVRFDLDDVDETCLNKTPNILFNKLSMLRNIEIIEFAADMYTIAANQLAALELILQNCKEKIRLYSLQLGLSDQDVLLSKLANKFTNAKIFYVSFYEKVDCVLLLWKSLDNNMTINNSDINTELSLPSKLQQQEYSKLIKFKWKWIKHCLHKVWINQIISKWC